MSCWRLSHRKRAKPRGHHAAGQELAQLALDELRQPVAGAAPTPGIGGAPQTVMGIIMKPGPSPNVPAALTGLGALLTSDLLTYLG